MSLDDELARYLALVDSLDHRPTARPEHEELGTARPVVRKDGRLDWTPDSALVDRVRPYIDPAR